MLFNKFTQSYGHTPMANLKKINNIQLAKIINYAKPLGYSDAGYVEHRGDKDIYLLIHDGDRRLESMP